MNDKQRRRYERGSRVDAFMTSNAADFPAAGKAAETAARLKSELAALSALDVEKAASAGARQQSAAGRRELRESLRARLAAICDTAEVIGREHPEARGLFPRARADNSDQTLVAVARSYAATAAPLKTRFVEYEMPADFIERLTAEADGLEDRMTRQTEGTGARVSTNAAIEEALGRLDDSVERLGVVVTNKYREDPARLAAWESACRLERAPRRKGNGGPPPTPEGQG